MNLSATPLKYYFDLDNTLCNTQDGDYVRSTPIKDRIQKVNALKEQGHTVVIWTARGSRSKRDHTLLTTTQLTTWGVKYDELLMGKPDYDIYVDDKSFNANVFWKTNEYPHPPAQPSVLGEPTKKTSSEIVEKGWGKEIIFINNEEYCGKILCFEKDKKCSMHYHLKKKETWYIAKGKLRLSFIDTPTGQLLQEILTVGDVITNERGEPHQLEALEYSEVFEVSTKHFDEDSYRIYKGD